MASAAKRADRETTEGIVLTQADDSARHDRRRRLRDRAGLEERGLPSPSRTTCSARCTSAGRRRSRCSRSSRAELAARLGENIQIVGARRITAGPRREARLVRAPAGEEGRRAARHARRLARAAARARDAHRVRASRRSGRATRCRPSSSRPSGRSSRSCPRCESKPADVREKIVDGMLNKRFYAESVLEEQTWIHDTSLTVEKALAAGRAGAPRVRLALGRLMATAAEQQRTRRPRRAPFRRVLLKLSGEALMGPSRVRPRRRPRSTRSRASSSRCTRPGSSSRS